MFFYKTQKIQKPDLFRMRLLQTVLRTLLGVNHNPSVYSRLHKRNKFFFCDLFIPVSVPSQTPARNSRCQFWRVISVTFENIPKNVPSETRTRSAVNATSHYPPIHFVTA